MPNEEIERAKDLLSKLCMDLRLYKEDKNKMIFLGLKINFYFLFIIK